MIAIISKFGIMFVKSKKHAGIMPKQSNLEAFLLTNGWIETTNTHAIYIMLFHSLLVIVLQNAFTLLLNSVNIEVLKIEIDSTTLSPEPGDKYIGKKPMHASAK